MPIVWEGVNQVHLLDRETVDIRVRIADLAKNYD
jgi:hypothetical protein